MIFKEFCMNNKYALVFSVLFLLLTFSCKDQSSEPEIIEYPVDNKPGFTLKLLDRGKEPRQIIKFKLKEGSKETGKIITDMDIQNTMKETQSPMVYMPSINIPVNSVVEEVDENGIAKIKYEIRDITVGDDPDADPNLVKSLRGLYSKIKLISCTAKVDPSGSNTKPECEFQGDLEPSLTESLKQVMENFSNNIFIPKEPVGLGAKWEITNPEMLSGGMLISINTMMQLVKLDGDNATIKSTLSQTAKEQTIKFPGTELESKLTSLNASGSGQMEINFHEFLPRGSTNFITDLTMIIKGQSGQTTEIQTNMAMRVNITD
jgi:hypothetical protein